MARRGFAVTAALIALSLSPGVLWAAADVPPAVRQPQMPHVCDRGPKKGCACTPTDDDPNGICSAIEFDVPFFENGPQCVPSVLPRPRASGILTYIVDDTVGDYNHPEDAIPTQAFTVMFEVKAPDGTTHLLSKIYQDLLDPTNTPSGVWLLGDGLGFEPVDEEGIVAFFGDPNTDGIPGLLRDFKPLLYLAPEAELSNALREMFQVPEGSLPIIVNSITDPQQAQVEVQAGEPLATVLRVNVEIGFIPPTLGVGRRNGCGASPAPTATPSPVATSVPTPVVEPTGLTVAHWRFYVRIATVGGGPINVSVPARSGDVAVEAAIRADHVPAFLLGHRVSGSAAAALGGDTLQRLSASAEAYIRAHPAEYTDFAGFGELRWAARVP